MPVGLKELVRAVFDDFPMRSLSDVLASVVYDWRKRHHTPSAFIRPFDHTSAAHGEREFVASLYEQAAKGPVLVNAPSLFYDHLQRKIRPSNGLNS